MKIMTKGFLSRCVGVFVIISVIITAPGSALGAENLIQNADFEIENASDSTLPLGWQEGFSSPQTASTYTYPTLGRLDTKAVRAEIDNATYVSGDAKWLFDDVAVEAGKNYIYSDYFKSNASNSVLVRFNGATNCPVIGSSTVCYAQIGATSPATVWTHFQTLFAIPAGVDTISILRTIVGDSAETTTWLELDDVSLELDTPALIVDHVPNNSLEETSYNGLSPKEWSPSGYGSNTRTFEYVNEGHESGKSVKVTVSSYTSGDAKWTYTAQPVTAGQDYYFTGWYKTNAIPHVVAQYTKNDGSISYFGMPRPEPDVTSATEWQQYGNEFSVPSDVKSVTVFFFLASNGWLQTDDFHITPYVYEGFNRPLVTLTFDDGFEENVTNALPILTAKGFKTTQCYDTSALEGISAQEALAQALAQAFITAGHEVCSHTVSHADLTTLPVGNETQPGTLRYELAHSKEYLETFTGGPVPNFASPFGAYNAEVNDVIREYYASHRTVDEGYNSKNNLNLYRLKVQNISTSVTPADFKEWVKKAEDENLWLIIVYHKVTDGPLEQFDIRTADFAEQMNWLASSTALVKSYADALSVIQDVIPPVITLTYSTTSPINGDVMVTASSNEGTLNAPSHIFTTNGDFDFVATDISGNVTTKTATVTNIDKSAPIITIEYSITSPTNQDVTVTAETNEGTLNVPSHTFTVNGSFDFIATDAAGNTTTETVTVNNIDKEAPIVGAVSNITIEATSPLGAEVVYALPDSNEPITCTPNSGSTFALGVTSVHCLASDVAGNTTPATFEITVVDTTAPEITLTGASPQAIELGESYIEQGATASDVVSGNLTPSVSIDASSVNTNIAGTYTVTYNVIDGAGNHAVTKTRTVQVASRTITVTADAKTKIFGEVDPVFTYILTSGSLLGTDSFVGQLMRTSGEAPGTYPISVGTLSAGPSYAINFIGSSLTILVPTCSSGTVLQDNVCVKKSSGGGGGSKKKVTPKSATTTPKIGTTTPIQQVLGATSSTPKYIFTVTLSVGSRGNDVVELQKRLTQEGVYTGPITGYFGPLTQAGVVRFQAKHGLPQVGIVGPLTRAVLNK